MAGSMGDYFQTGSGSPSGAPSIPGVEWCWYQDIDTGNVYYWDLFTTAWALVAAASVEYPKRAIMFHDEALVISGAALDRQHQASQNYSVLPLQNGGSGGANGDTFTNGCFLKAGSYTLSVLGFTGTGTGKLDWYIDNVLQGAGGQDWYSGSSVFNVIKTLAVTVVGDGWHVIRGTVNGKNGSSAGYNIQLSILWLNLSAD